MTAGGRRTRKVHIVSEPWFASGSTLCGLPVKRRSVIGTDNRAVSRAHCCDACVLAEIKRGGAPVTSPERRPTCDREGCPRRLAPMRISIEAAVADCDDHAVDWRARAIAAESDAAKWRAAIARAKEPGDPVLRAIAELLSCTYLDAVPTPDDDDYRRELAVAARIVNDENRERLGTAPTTVSEKRAAAESTPAWSPDACKAAPVATDAESMRPWLCMAIAPGLAAPPDEIERGPIITLSHVAEICGGAGLVEVMTPTRARRLSEYIDAACDLVAPRREASLATHAVSPILRAVREIEVRARLWFQHANLDKTRDALAAMRTRKP